MGKKNFFEYEIVNDSGDWSPVDTSETSSTWWNELFNNFGNWLSGAASLTDAIKGNQDVYYIQTDNRSNNTGTYVIIGVVALVVIIILILALKK